MPRCTPGVRVCPPARHGDLFTVGALRAAELAPFGMAGVGTVYAACARGGITGDGEVAVGQAPDTRPPRRQAHARREDPAVSQPRSRGAVFSAGSRGAAVAKVMAGADDGTDAIVHARRAEIADGINTTYRNRTFGTHLGQGMSVEQAAAAPRQTTEGVRSAEAILALARAHAVETPIAEVLSDLKVMWKE